MSLRSVIDAVQSGALLCKHLRQNAKGETVVVWHLEPSGGIVTEDTALAAIRSGKLHPQGDGLFDVTLSQTWGRAAALSPEPHADVSKVPF